MRTNLIRAVLRKLALRFACSRFSQNSIRISTIFNKRSVSTNEVIQQVQRFNISTIRTSASRAVLRKLALRFTCSRFFQNSIRISTIQQAQRLNKRSDSTICTSVYRAVLRKLALRFACSRFPQNSHSTSQSYPTSFPPRLPSESKRLYHRLKPSSPILSGRDVV